MIRVVETPTIEEMTEFCGENSEDLPYLMNGWSLPLVQRRKKTWARLPVTIVRRAATETRKNIKYGYKVNFTITKTSAGSFCV